MIFWAQIYSVPVLKQLIDDATTEAAEDDFLVTMSAQSKCRAEEEFLQKEKEKKSGAIPSFLSSDPSDKFEVWIQNLDDGLFGRAKQTLTREQKRKNRQAYWEDKSQNDDCDEPPIGDTKATKSIDRSDEEQIAKHALDISAEEMRILQDTDTILDAVREAVIIQSTTSVWKWGDGSLEGADWRGIVRKSQPWTHAEGYDPQRLCSTDQDGMTGMGSMQALEGSIR